MAGQPKRSRVRNVLDEGKRMKIVALLSNGSSRRTAARIVGCAPSTVTYTICEASNDHNIGS
jgi:IS30 family transposase